MLWTRRTTGQTSSPLILAMLALVIAPFTALALASQPANQLANQPALAARRPDADKAPKPDADPNAADEIEFSQFAEPVDLQVLVDYISKRLQINIIISDTGLAGQQVVFRAPMQVRDDQLLPLLGMLIEPLGYTITRDPEQGWFVIRPSNNVRINLDDKQFATTQIYPTPLTRPSAIKAAIEQAIPADLSKVKIAYVDELGVIISTAPPGLNKSIRLIIDLILSGAKNQKLHRFDLTHIAASEARGRILELIGQSSATPGAGGRPGAQSAAGAMGNLAERFMLDRLGNALIFRGDENEIARIQELVTLVDQKSRLIIRRYVAGAMAPIIVKYGERLGLGSSVTSAAGGASGRGAATATGAAGSGFVIEKGDAGWFTYYGTEEQQKRVKELIEQYAEQARLERFVVQFYKLHYTNAVETADLLTELLDIQTDQDQAARSPFLPRSLEGQRGVTRTDQLRGRQGDAGLAQTPPTGAPNQPAQPGAAPAGGDQGSSLTPTEGISIIADEARNQLIIRAPVKQQSEFAHIIEQLDQRRPQVYLDVQIISVNSSTNFSLTVDTAIQSVNRPVFTNFGLRGAPFNNTTVPTGASGITAAIVRSNYIPIIVNALASEADGRILSHPRVLVNDNEQAVLSSTRDEPFSSTSQVAGAPSQTSLGGTLSAGTTLTVEPHISEGGFLVLTFTIELSAFGERPNPNLPPVRTSDNFDSVVTIPADSTVVVGGFTFEQTNNSVSKVPILGDIPFLGELFKNTSKSKSNQMIYVFITPRVIGDPRFTDLRLLSQGPISKLGAETNTPMLEPMLMELFDADDNYEDEDNQPAVDDTMTPAMAPDNADTPIDADTDAPNNTDGVHQEQTQDAASGDNDAL